MMFHICCQECTVYGGQFAPYGFTVILSFSLQDIEEVQVPTKPQAGVQFGARRTNCRVGLLK